MGKSKGGKKGKGKGKGGPKEKKLPKVLDGLKPAEMGRPALLGFILRLQVSIKEIMHRIMIHVILKCTNVF